MKQSSNFSMHLLKLLKQPTAVSLVMNGKFGPSAQPASFSAPLDPRQSFNPLSLVGGACHPTNALRRRCRVRCHRHSAPVVPFAPTSSPPSLLSLPLSHDALQELREIHSQQQRHKQKEMEGEAHALMSVSAERKSAELQESR